MKTLFKITFALSAILLSFSSFAQQYLNQVIVLNEGHYDYVMQQIVKPVTVGYYIPQTNTYTTFDTIEYARFATDVVVEIPHRFQPAHILLLIVHRFSNRCCTNTALSTASCDLIIVYANILRTPTCCDDTGPSLGGLPLPLLPPGLGPGRWTNCK